MTCQSGYIGQSGVKRRIKTVNANSRPKVLPVDSCSTAFQYGHATRILVAVLVLLGRVELRRGGKRTHVTYRKYKQELL